ncbi:sugar phosphate isomerase/epimerase family protein [Agilicoccus flavus]|uniref:sugar phosphate isomerase/epimerase family protein n=1 Tax=Agilicoccus flavus TaxID=2775968 RepID=UPI001CF60B71|nr:sugar phosphate isomerase/epimerase [Agilicoccus flavus]
MSETTTTSPIGCHGLVFSGNVDEQGIAEAVARTEKAGFDLLEIPLLDPFGFDVAAAKRALAAHDVQVTASLGLPEGADISTGDPEQVQRGEKVLQRVLEVMSDLESRHVCGVLYGMLKKYPAPATDAGRAASQEVLARIGRRATELGITVSLEIVNRYESNMFNTATGALAFLDEIGEDALKAHLDTYHMNIEESDMFLPVLAAAQAGRLGYVHIGESHRGYLGTGTVDFDSFFRALHHVGYDGPITFESFSTAVVDDVLSTSLAIWRNLWKDGDDLAAHANAYIRGALRSNETLEMH